MTVTVSDYYVPGCEVCCAEIERITRAAVRDFSVTKLSFTPGHRHNHEVEKAGKALTAHQQSAPTPLPPSGELFIEGTAGSSAGALNGFDHAAGSERSIANSNR